MSKFTALAIGLLSVISVVPTAQAATGSNNQPNLQQPDSNLHAQVFIRFGAPLPPRPYYRDELIRRRQWQIEREREAELRREFYSRRYRDREEFYRGEPRGIQVEFRGGPGPALPPPH